MAAMIASPMQMTTSTDPTLTEVPPFFRLFDAILHQVAAKMSPKFASAGGRGGGERKSPQMPESGNDPVTIRKQTGNESLQVEKSVV